MPTPISEQIAVIVKSRLTAISTGSGYETTASEVVRPTKHGGFRPQDYQIIVLPRANSKVQEFAGNPPKIERRLELELRGTLRPSDTSSTAISTLILTFAADMEKAVTSVTNWRNFGGLSINASYGEQELIEVTDDAGVVSTSVDVIYRHPEGDPYTVAT